MPERLEHDGVVTPAGFGRALETTQTVLTALILAFIFRAFLVEPFIIPTGSMAESLLGTHATRTCPACGWEYNFAPYRNASPTERGFVRPSEIICPNCQLRLVPTAEDTFPKSGDRVLVHKWPHACAGMFPPQRWEITVFRDPANPEQHYIKRLIGLPGETVEIIAGDLFIDGRIARKPPSVQRGMWFIVFDQNHLANPAATSGRLPRWMPLDTPEPDGAGWSGLATRVIRYNSDDQIPRTITFNPDTGREYLLDLYAYNGRSSGTFVGDVRVLSELTLQDGDGWCRWELTRPPYRFCARLVRSGRVELHMQSLENPATDVLLGSRVLPASVRAGRPLAVEFGHVDYRVYLKLDGRQVLASTDSDYAPRLEELRDATRQHPVSISVSAQDLRLELRGLRIERDVHYTRSPHSRRAYARRPFTLGIDQYFVLGDNSPDSHDSREWTEVGPHLPADYREGTVAANQIVGQAAFVYLPGLLPRDAGGRWRVPDLGRVRFVR